MIAVVPGYISRSVAGSYDNEGKQMLYECGSYTKMEVIDVDRYTEVVSAVIIGIAIFCMLLTYYMWIKAVKTGSIYWSSMCALAYFYMVSCLICL